MKPELEKDGYEWKAKSLEPKVKKEKGRAILSQPYTSPENLERYSRMRKIRIELKKINVSNSTKERLRMELELLKKKTIN